MRAPDSGLTMKRCADAGLRSASMLGMRCAAAAIFCKAEASDKGRPADLGAGTVGLVFARAADRHLHEGRGQRSEDHEEERADDPDIAAVVAPSAEKEAEIGEHRDRARDRRGNRHQKRVAVLDVAELVRDHAGKLVLIDRAAAGPS